MARAELESFKEESQSLQFTAPMLRARAEMERIAEEMGRLEGQEKKAGAQVRQLDAVLGDAKSRLAAVTAADEMAGEILSDLKAALRRVDEETEAAEKERALTELENGCAVADAESVAAEIAAAEKRIRAAVRELEAARAGEAAATGKLREVVESERWARASTVSQRSGNVTIPRFEYEYLAGRAEVVRAVADKKVAAAEAWVEARRAGEKEMIMRAEAIERELGEDDGVAVAQAVNDDEEQQRPREGLQRAPSTRPVRATGSSAVTSRRKTMAAVLSTSSSPMHRNPRAPPSIRVENKKMRVLIPNYLKLISGKFTGRK
jgi:chromosome segregation ATPase